MDNIFHLINPVKLLYATLMFLGFVVATFVGTKYLPGKLREGAIQSDGNRKLYKLNGLVLFVVTTLAVVAGTLLFDLSLAPLHEYFWYLFAAANLFAFVWAGILYVAGKGEKPLFGKILRDLWFGVELNPTWLGVDLKMFAYQPSLIGLGLINASFAFVQYETYDRISIQMWMLQLSWWLYLASHYYYEEFMLSTWDVIAEKFGFMLVWGDLVLVPFFYSIVGWFLVDRIQPLPWSAVVGVSLLYLFGLWLFRGANLQKHRFKQDPNTNIWGHPAQTIGGKLLISGWWGIGRKLNYTGEICLYLAIALTTGFDSFVPYLLPLWLCLLLIHRARRDEHRCRSKYGDLWTDYCTKARFRMMPFVY
jgi:Delta14-sterol reductase